MTPVLRARALSKVFGAREREALRLAGEGLGRDEARRAFALMVLNLNEFLYLD